MTITPKPSLLWAPLVRATTSLSFAHQARELGLDLGPLSLSLPYELSISPVGSTFKISVHRPPCCLSLCQLSLCFYSCPLQITLPTVIFMTRKIRSYHSPAETQERLSIPRKIKAELSPVAYKPLRDLDSTHHASLIL